MRCDPQLLWTLVKQTHDPPESFSRVLRHLESCVQCQQTLHEYAGGETWANDVSRWYDPELERDLRSGECASLESNSGHDAAIALQFLEPPSHPEMLGRIGRYEVEGVLGRGGMGIVLRAFDTELQRTVAIKVLAPEWSASPAARQRFAREAQAAASVAHENVVPIYNVSADSSPPYLVMRYIPGETLEQWVEREGPLDAEAIIRVASQLAAGLNAAHSRGLVHRDVKPANVLVGENTERVWLSDFGLARAADEARMTRTGVIAGSPHYMSPEQAKGQPLDHCSDWFSLGCLLYFLACGSPPFDAPTTLAILQQTISTKPKSILNFRRDLPPTLIELIEKLLTKRPERRPADFSSVDEMLRRAEREYNAGISRRRRVLWPLAVCGAAVLGLLIPVIYWFPQAETIDRHESTGVAAANDNLIDDPWENISLDDLILHQQQVDQILALEGWETDGFEELAKQLEEELGK